MTNEPWDLVLEHAEAFEAFADLSVRALAHIRVLPTGGTASAAAAEKLVLALRQELSLTGRPVAITGAPDMPPETARLLVLVGDAEGWQANQAIAVEAVAALVNEESGRQILTVLQKGVDIDAAFPGEPAAIRELNIAWWHEEPGELAAKILAMGGVATRAFRIFLSYRRIDTQPVAEQLFTALTKEGFQVFVDRFSVPPGERFQRFLAEKLEEMSMVMVLESANFRNTWTDYEVNFAVERRLGVCALHTGSASVEIGSIAEANRLRLGAADLVKGELTKDALRSAVDFALRQHNRAYVYCSRRLREDLLASLRSVQLSPEVTADDAMVLVKANERTYKLWPCPRPTMLSDVYDSFWRDPEHRRPTTVAVVIAPGIAVNPLRGRPLTWVQDLAQVRHYDALQTMKLARDISSGALR